MWLQGQAVLHVLAAAVEVRTCAWLRCRHVHGWAATPCLTPRHPCPPSPPASAVQVYVQCPKVDGSDALTGQLLAVEMPSLLATVSELKARLSDVLSLPPGKQQLSREHVGIMKNELTLAFYNVGQEVHLQLGIKERGGRKK